MIAALALLGAICSLHGVLSKSSWPKMVGSLLVAIGSAALFSAMRGWVTPYFGIRIVPTSALLTQLQAWPVNQEVERRLIKGQLSEPELDTLLLELRRFGGNGAEASGVRRIFDALGDPTLTEDRAKPLAEAAIRLWPILSSKNSSGWWRTEPGMTMAMLDDPVFAHRAVEALLESLEYDIVTDGARSALAVLDSAQLAGCLSESQARRFLRTKSNVGITIAPEGSLWKSEPLRVGVYGRRSSSGFGMGSIPWEGQATLEAAPLHLNRSRFDFTNGGWGGAESLGLAPDVAGSYHISANVYVRQLREEVRKTWVRAPSMWRQAVAWERVQDLVVQMNLKAVIEVQNQRAEPIQPLENLDALETLERDLRPQYCVKYHEQSGEWLGSGDIEFTPPVDVSMAVYWDIGEGAPVRMGWFVAPAQQSFRRDYLAVLPKQPPSHIKIIYVPEALETAHTRQIRTYWSGPNLEFKACAYRP